MRALIALIAMIAAASAYGQMSPTFATVQLQIPNVQLVNQDGEQVSFNSGVIGNRIAVINTIFTTCTTICPIAGANFARLAEKLGSRLGKDVVLVSISTDSMNDTPARLREWGARFHVRQGWSLLTGPKPEVDKLLKSLGLYAADRQDHPSTVLIGSQAAGWTRASTLASSDKLLEVIERFLLGHQ